MKFSGSLELISSLPLVIFENSDIVRVNRFINLTLRRPNFLGAHLPVPPDLAKTVKVKSDHSENLARVLEKTPRVANSGVTGA